MEIDKNIDCYQRKKGFKILYIRYNDKHEAVHLRNYWPQDQSAEPQHLGHVYKNSQAPQKMCVIFKPDIVTEEEESLKGITLARHSRTKHKDPNLPGLYFSQ